MRQLSHQSNLRKGRVSEQGRIYLVTFCTQDRRRLFTDFWVGRAVVQALKTSQEKGFSHSLVWVVMPDHVHWLMQLEQDHLEKVVARVKAEVARQLHLGVVWQKGFHDHALRSDEDVKTIARYVVANPIRAGLVKSMAAYPLWDAVWL